MFAVSLLSGCGDDAGDAPPARDAVREYTAAVGHTLDGFFAENARFELRRGTDAGSLEAAARKAADRLQQVSPPAGVRAMHRELTGAFSELADVYQTSSVLLAEAAAQTVQAQAIERVDASLAVLEAAGFDISQTTEYEKRMGKLDDREGLASDSLERAVAAARRSDSTARAAAAWRRFAAAVLRRAVHMAVLSAPEEVRGLHGRFAELQRGLAGGYLLEARAVADGGGNPFLERRAPDALQALIERRDRLQLVLTTRGYDTTGSR